MFLYDISAFMLNFIFYFSINSVVFYEIFYNDVNMFLDVTHYLTDSNENCTVYVKFNSKIFLFMELF